MIRVTTNGTLRGYRSSLMRSTNNLNAARDKVLSQRNFNSFAEDPTAATQAFKLRRSFSRVDDQLSNNKNLTKRYQSAWDALSTVKSDLVEKEGKVSALAALSSPTASGRQPLAQGRKGAASTPKRHPLTQKGEPHAQHIFHHRQSHRRTQAALR